MQNSGKDNGGLLELAEAVAIVIRALKKELTFGRIKLGVLALLAFGGAAAALQISVNEKLEWLVRFGEVNAVDVWSLILFAIFTISANLYMSSKDKKHREKALKTISEANLDDGTKKELLDKIIGKL